jgi:hypothetical protein
MPEVSNAARLDLITDIAPVIERSKEIEVKNAAKSLEEVGDPFALVNLIRWHGFDAESLLRQMTALPDVLIS